MLPSALLLLLLAACRPQSSPGGGSDSAGQAQIHLDHGAAHVHPGEPGAPSGELEPLVVTAFTSQAELFMEYPVLWSGLQARFLAHLTVLASGEPVRSGRLRLELTGGGGQTLVLEAAAPARDGLFIPVGAIEAPGLYDARIVIESPQLNETFRIDPLVVYASPAAARSATGGQSAEEPADAVAFLLEQQWSAGLLLEVCERRSLRRRLHVAAQIEAPHSSLAVVGAPLAGQLLPPASGRMPGLGEYVELGQELGFIEAPLTLADSAQLASNLASHEALGMELLIKEVELSAEQLELEQAEHQAASQLVFAQQALERLEALRQKDLGTQSELEAARRDLEIAQREVAGRAALRQGLLEARRRFDELREQTNSRQAAARAAATRRFPLIAPLAGEVIAVQHIAGEQVEGQAEVFRIHAPEQLWVALHISEFDLAELTGTPAALLEFSAFPGRRFDLAADLGGSLVQTDRTVDPADRTVTMRFSIANPQAALRIGMLAEAYLETQHVQEALALPEEAIVMDGGLPVAFVLLAGETFQKRRLKLGLRDGRHFEVLEGIQAGERVATKGAYLVKLAAASPSTFGAGHAH